MLYNSSVRQLSDEDLTVWLEDHYIILEAIKDGKVTIPPLTVDARVV